MRRRPGISLSYGLVCLWVLAACQSSDIFHPRSDYPPDPWVKSYTRSEDCPGGEQLAARIFRLPEYPRRAFRTGVQGWVILRLDVDAQGSTKNVRVERAVPDRFFATSARSAARRWQFEPPQGGTLYNCRVLIRYRLGQVSLGR